MDEQALQFQYFEIRPVHEAHGQIVSYPSFEAYRETGKEADYWTIYGIGPEHEATAIGDFKTFKDAEQIMWAIQTPLLKVKEMLEDGEDREVRQGLFLTPAEQALSIIEDFTLQCSNDERI